MSAFIKPLIVNPAATDEFPVCVRDQSTLKQVIDHLFNELPLTENGWLMSDIRTGTIVTDCGWPFHGTHILIWKPKRSAAP